MGQLHREFGRNVQSLQVFRNQIFLVHDQICSKTESKQNIQINELRSREIIWNADLDFNNAYLV